MQKALINISSNQYSVKMRSIFTSTLTSGVRFTTQWNSVSQWGFLSGRNYVSRSMVVLLKYGLGRLRMAPCI